MASFKEAFAKARKEKGAGATFTWNGKSYSTNIKEEGLGAKKPTTPKPRPTASASASSKPPARPAAKPSAVSGASRSAAGKAIPKGMGNYTKAEWKGMTLEARQARGLPLRPIDSWVAKTDWKKPAGGGDGMGAWRAAAAKKG